MMTDDAINELVLAFLDEHVASERELFLMVKQAVASERAFILDLFSMRLGMSVSTMMEYLPELAEG